MTDNTKFRYDHQGNRQCTGQPQVLDETVLPPARVFSLAESQFGDFRDARGVRRLFRTYVDGHEVLLQNAGAQA